MKLIMLVILVFSSLSGKEIVFNNSETIFTIDGGIAQGMAFDFADKVIRYTKKDMYIYINSPGGDVMAMFKMIDAMKMSDINFICVANFAASAAHSIFEMCNERYIMPNGILMAHEASITIAGKLASMKGLISVIERRINSLNKIIAKRSNMSYEEYDLLVAKDLWMDSTYATELNQIDGVISKISCTKELINKNVVGKKGVSTMLGIMEIEVALPACPLLSKPKTD